MPIFLPVTSGPRHDAEPFERAPVECLVRHSTDAESVRKLRGQKKAAGDGSDDDQFAVVFRMMMSCEGAQPPVQTQKTLSLPSDESATAGAEGINALTTGTSGSGTPGVETAASSVSVAVTSAATASVAVSVPQIRETVRHRIDPAPSQQAGIQADQLSPDAAGLKAKFPTTTLNETILNARPSNHSSLTTDTNVSLTAAAGSISGKVLPGAVEPAAAAAPLFELEPDPADLSDEMAAALERIGRPAAGDSVTNRPAEVSLSSAAPVKEATPPAIRELRLLTHPNSSDGTDDASSGISAQPAAPDVHPTARKPMAHHQPDASLPTIADQWQTELVLSAQSAGTFSTQELSAAISGELRQPLTHQVSQAVIDRLERSDISDTETMTVQLDPPDLGEMVIELSKTRDGLAIRVTAREAVTMDMLLARGSEIESQLRGRELDLKTLEFLPPNMTGGGGFERQQRNSARQSGELQLVRRSARRASGEAVTIPGGGPSSGEPRHAMSFRA